MSVALRKQTVRYLKDISEFNLQIKPDHVEALRHFADGGPCPSNWVSMFDEIQSINPREDLYVAREEAARIRKTYINNNPTLISDEDHETSRRVSWATDISVPQQAA